ncbi:MAG: SseB family protein [Cypionkella sp.]
MTTLDQAHAAMQAAEISDGPVSGNSVSGGGASDGETSGHATSDHAILGAEAPGNEGAALAFWRALADAELFLVLEREAEGDTMEPKVFDLSMGRMLLAFDNEERLATVSDQALPYAVLPGRVVAAQLAGQGLALGLNLGTGAPSETVLPAEAIDWLVQMLTQSEPEEREAQIARLDAPLLPDGLLAALIGLLPQQALGALAQAEYHGGGWGHVLAFAGLGAGDEARMARAVTEALAFSGLDAAALDLVFTSAETVLFGRIARAGQLLKPPVRAIEPQNPPVVPQGPGTDPNRPPYLK